MYFCLLSSVRVFSQQIIGGFKFYTIYYVGSLRQLNISLLYIMSIILYVKMWALRNERWLYVYKNAYSRFIILAQQFRPHFASLCELISLMNLKMLYAFRAICFPNNKKQYFALYFCVYNLKIYFLNYFVRKETRKALNGTSLI